MTISLFEKYVEFRVVWRHNMLKRTYFGATKLEPTENYKGLYYSLGKWLVSFKHIRIGESISLKVILESEVLPKKNL